MRVAAFSIAVAVCVGAIAAGVPQMPWPAVATPTFTRDVAGLLPELRSTSRATTSTGRRTTSSRRRCRCPEGAKLIATAWYDNSAENRSNPDPTMEARWGAQVWDEIHYTGILVSPGR